MADEQKKTIMRVRTFNDDIARARGEKVVHTPKVSKQKVSAQELTDTLLKDTIDTHSAEDFIGTTDGGYIPMDVTTDTKLQSLPQKKENKKLKKQLTHTFPVTKKTTDTNKETVHNTTPAPQQKTVSASVKNTPSQKKKPSLENEIEQITALTEQPEIATLAVADNDVQDGTIITNKKRKRFRLLPAIGDSIKSWFSHTAEELTTPNESTQTIASAKSRIETIKEAARASKRAPVDDHGIVIKKLKKKRNTDKKQSSAVTIKEKEKVTTPQWASAQDASPSPRPEHSSIEEKEIDTQQASSTIVDTTRELDTQKHQQVPKTPTAVPQQEKDTSPSTQPMRNEVPNTPTAQPSSHNKVLTTNTPKTKETLLPKKVSQKKRTYRATPTTTSGIPVYVYLGVILVASLTGIGITLYWFASSTAQEEAVVLRIPTLFTTDQHIAVEMQNDTQSFLSTLLDQTLTTRETIQIYPARTSEEAIRVPVPPQEILEVLAWRAPGSFIRSITDITFGSYNGTSPFIVLKTTNFDTAFAGLLEWEPDMSADLSPLFGLPVTQSFDPYARTDTQIRSAFFRDSIISNKSARILVDSQDNERLVYVFVTPQIILIAPDTPTITAILPLVTQ